MKGEVDYNRQIKQFSLFYSLGALHRSIGSQGLQMWAGMSIKETDRKSF